MSTFKVTGGYKLKGDVYPQGAKNEALQVLCAVLLTEEKVKISNIPDIRDVNKLIELLGSLGVEVTKNGKGVYTFQAKDINLEYLQSDEYRADGSALRGSV